MSRNLLGALLGGTFGILVCGYWEPMAFPAGVLLGVVIGWWAEDIATAFVQSYHVACTFWQRLKAWLVPNGVWPLRGNFLERLSAFIRLTAGRVRAMIARAYEYVLLRLGWIATVVQMVLRVPRRFVDWVVHPASQAILISISVIVVGAALNALAIGMFWPWPETHMVGGLKTPLTEVPFEFSDIAISTGIATLLLTMCGFSDYMRKEMEDNSVRAFYSRWEQYSQHSAPSYFVRELVRFFRSEAVTLLFIVATFLYWLTLGGALLVFVVVPVMMFVTFMVSLYKIAQRSAHWWCFGITLVVTAISALIFYDSFNNQMVLWTVALGTGIVSGVVSEGLRQLGAWWGTTKTGQYCLDIWDDHKKITPFAITTPAWLALGRIYVAGGRRLVPHAF